MPSTARAIAAPVAPARGPIPKDMVQWVFTEICAQGIVYPQEVMKQAILETGWFRSDFLMSRNNLFGFRKISYYRFDRWQDSVSYYKNWQVARLKPEHTHHLIFLKTFNYATPDYIQHLAKISWAQECPAADVVPATPHIAPPVPSPTGEIDPSSLMP
jgi:hypothetical protein